MAFSTSRSTTSLPFLIVSDKTGNFFFHSESVKRAIPMLCAICSSDKPSRAHPCILSRPSPSSHSSYLHGLPLPAFFSLIHLTSSYIAIIAAVVAATQIAVSAISDNIVISSLIYSSFYARKKTSHLTSPSRSSHICCAISIAAYSISISHISAGKLAKFTNYFPTLHPNRKSCSNTQEPSRAAHRRCASSLHPICT